MTRRELLIMVSGAVVSMPFLTRMPQWYGTAAQWVVHAREGVLMLAKHGRLTHVPPSALANHPIPASFITYTKHWGRSGQFWVWYDRMIGHDRVIPKQWLGHWQDAHGRILAWVDRRGQAWWAKP